MSVTPEQLIAAAIEASKNAYAPYSKFHVGSALLVDDDNIIVGCNVENASYGLTICAERNAIFNAVVRNKKNVKAVAIVADGDSTPYPCGACRQVLNEFCSADTPVYVASIKKPNDIISLSMGELLPHSFKFED